jgi:hypothetical protein
VVFLTKIGLYLRKEGFKRGDSFLIGTPFINLKKSCTPDLTGFGNLSGLFLAKLDIMSGLHKNYRKCPKNGIKTG